MSRQILAIDIRNDFIAAVLLNTGLKNSTVQAYAHVPLTGTSIQSGHLAAALAALPRKLTPTGAYVAASLPADRAFFRNIVVPFKEENKIRQVLPFELEPSLPMPVEDMFIDFQKDPDSGSTEVFAAAIAQQTLSDYKAVFAEATKPLQLIIPGGFALIAGLIDQNQLADQALILDIDTDKVTLFAVMNKRIALVRTLAGSVTTEAEIETLTLKIRQTLTAFCDAKGIDFVPEIAYFTGPGVHSPQYTKMLDQALDIPLQAVDLRESDVKIDFIQSIDEWHPWMMDGALALALSEAEGWPCLSFLRKRSILGNFWNTYRSYLTTPLVLVALVILLSFGGVILNNYFLQKRVDQLDTQIKDIFKTAFPNTALTQEPLTLMQSKLKEIKNNAFDPNQGGPQWRGIEILNQVSTLIPKSVEVLFSRIVIGGNIATISGETGTFNAVDDIKSRLEKDDYFKQVTIASANMDKSGKKVRFKLKIKL